MNELRELAYYRHLPAMLLQQTPTQHRDGLTFELSLVKYPQQATRNVCVRAVQRGKLLMTMTAEDSLLPGSSLQPVENTLSRAWADWRAGAGWQAE